MAEDQIVLMYKVVPSRVDIRPGTDMYPDPNLYSTFGGALRIAEKLNETAGKALGDRNAYGIVRVRVTIHETVFECYGC